MIFNVECARRDPQTSAWTYPVERFDRMSTVVTSTAGPTNEYLVVLPDRVATWFSLWTAAGSA